MTIKSFYIIAVAWVAAMVAATSTSCINDDFTTSPTDVLSFSVDSVKFDTVITAQSTPTKQFLVYNRSKKQLNISSIKIESNEGTGAHFYLNVDGVKGDEFHDIEVRGNDSIFVFVESVVDPTGVNEPFEVKDRISFVTNGVTQQVVVTAWGQDAIVLDDATIAKSTTFTAKKPYVVYGTLTVVQGATLTMEPGTRMLFHDKASMNVEGRLLAQGSREQPVELRGDRLDHVVGMFSFDIMSGQWGGIDIGPESHGNEMSYVNMRGSSTGVTVTSNNPALRSLHLFNSVLRNSSSTVLMAANARIEAEGTELSDAAGSIFAVMGGRVSFVNCTLANYYLFSVLADPLMSIFIQDDEQQLQPLRASFDNCIFYGNIEELNMGDFTGYEVYMRNCLFKSKGSDDANFINCKWGADPKFFTEREKYIFDYRLRNGSDAIAAGDRALCPAAARYDRYGQDRLARDGIDIGAYVWVPQAEQ